MPMDNTNWELTDHLLEGTTQFVLLAPSAQANVG